MAFVSMLEMRKFSRGAYSSPAVTFNMSGTAYITKAVFDEGKQPTIDVQIDLDIKQIRLRVGDGLARKLGGRVGHTFACPKNVVREVLPANEKTIRIELEKSQDGWWYGSYAAQEKAQ